MKQRKTVRVNFGITPAEYDVLVKASGSAETVAAYVRRTALKTALTVKA